MANRFLSNIKINDAYTFPASDGTNGQVIKTDGSGNLSFAQLAADSASVMYKDTFTGNGSTTAFTLANALNDEVQSNVYIDGVYQSKSTYSVSGTTLTFSTAPASGHEIEVISTTGINSGPTAIYTDTFTANGSATAFTLGQTVHDENQTIVFLNGVYQFKGTYTLSGTTLTLDTAPANGVAIEVMSIGSAYSGGDILYDHDFGSAGLMTTNGSGVYSITANNSANWNTAYGWGDHSTQSYATQSYVGTQISNLVDSSPATLDTLNELAAALGDDPNFATTTANSIGTKMPLAGGTFTGDVTVSKDAAAITINSTNGTQGTLHIGRSADTKAKITSGDTAASDLCLYTSGTRAVTILSNQNATFAGNVTAPTIDIASTSVYQAKIRSTGAQYLLIGSTNAGSAGIVLDGDSNGDGAGGDYSYLLHEASGVLKLQQDSPSGTNELHLGTAGIESRLVMDSSGNVGINETSLTEKLEVNGAIVWKGALTTSKTSAGVLDRSGDDLRIRVYGATAGSGNLVFRTGGGGGSVDSEAMRLTSSGNVGIGYTSPASVLHVGSTGTNAYSATITKGSNMKGIINTLSNNADDMVGIYFATGSTTEGTHWSGITGSRSDNASHWGTQLNFYTHNNDVNALNDATQKMVIKGDGNVGIGTTSPTKQLHLKRTSGDVRGIMVETTVATSYAEVQVKAASEFRIGTGGSSTTPNGQFYVYDATAGAHRFDIDANGNVGIGTTSPGQKLEVYQAATNSQAYVTVRNNRSRNAAVLTQTTNGGFYTGTSIGTDTLCWQVYDASAGERMRIDSSGNVAIGATSSSSKLKVEGPNTPSNPLVDLVASGTGSFQRGVRLLNGGMNAGDEIMYSVGRSDNTRNMGQMYFHYAGAVSTSNRISMGLHGVDDVFNIAGTGNVGIGTTSPAQKLDVNGHIAIRDTYKIFFNHNTDTARYIGASSANDLDIASNDDINYRSNYNRFWDGSTEFARLSGSTNSWIANGSNGKLGIATTSPKAKLDVDGDVNTTGYLANTLEFSTFFGSGTTVIATLNGNFESGTTAVASIEYVGLYAYAGTNTTLGLIMAATRRSNNNTTWTNVNDETIHVAGSTGSEPTLYWDNGLLKITVGSSVQISCRIRITYHGSNTGLTRNHSA